MMGGLEFRRVLCRSFGAVAAAGTPADLGQITRVTAGKIAGGGNDHIEIPLRLRHDTAHRGPPTIAFRGREPRTARRSEEHTSELQSPDPPLCRLLL